jgi:hypothetical protein
MAAPKLYHNFVARVKEKMQIIWLLLQFIFANNFPDLNFLAESVYNRTYGGQ